jgi:Rps23 Pro-64 3,4-dihydroxylase Tpa1-like proline 4-hydroxylase
MSNIKIKKDELEIINLLDSSILDNFGEWTKDIDNLSNKFLNNQPFEHIIIDNFLDENYANVLYNLFPEKFDNWYVYENPIEVKYTYDNIEKLEEPMNKYFYYLSSNVMINIFRKLTNIEDLTFDEYLHGAGLHCHPKYGRLNIHLDYEKHPITNTERRLNIILFLSKNWNKEWNGENELWDKDVKKCIVKTEVVFNRAIIFKTNDVSWHGLPKPIICPEDQYRKSLAFYYVSPLQSIKTKYRNKAKYVVVDEKNKNDINLNKLCKIRENRRLTIDDINTYYPGWEKNNIQNI